MPRILQIARSKYQIYYYLRIKMLNLFFARDLLSAFGLNKSKISNILNKEGGATIEELLAEEDAVTECKQQNQKLLEFLCRKENLAHLIKYATRLPTDPDNHVQAHKYPFVATDILVSCMRIADSLIPLAEEPKPAAESAEDGMPQLEEQKEEEIDLSGNAEDEKKQSESPAVKQASTDEENAEEHALERVKELEAAKKPEGEQEQAEGTGLVDPVEKEEDLESEEKPKAATQGEDSATADFDRNLEKVLETNEPLRHAEEQQTTHKQGTQQQPISQKDLIGNIDDEDDDDEDDDEVNIADEDDEDDSGKGSAKNKFSIEVQKLKSKPSKMASEALRDTSKFDFALMDVLFEFIDNASEDSLQPILCGYFNKIVQSLLNKSKSKLLTYILLKRQGDLLIKLVNHLQYHSLALLLIELLQQKVVSTPSRARFNSDLGSDRKDGDDEEKSKNNPQEEAMLEVLNSRRQEIVARLIRDLSAANKSDFEQCLNAQTVLMEISDNDQMYPVLAQPDHLTNLLYAACDIRNPNQAYALQVLTSIIKEFPESQLSPQAGPVFQQTIAKHFFDMTYSALLLLRSQDSASERDLGAGQTAKVCNQAGITQKRFGIKRLRALELLREVLNTFSKFVDLNSDQYISSILRRQFIVVMLDVIDQYGFNSLACQQAIKVLDFLKNAFDDDDIETLKSYVQKRLAASADEDKTMVQFDSGNITSAGNLAAIVKMAIVIKQMTLGEGEEAEKSERSFRLFGEDKREEPPAVQASADSQRSGQSRWSVHKEDLVWLSFCSNELQAYEDKWNKKLEEEKKPQQDMGKKDNGGLPEGFVLKKPKTLEEQKRNQQKEDDSEPFLENMLKNGVVKKNQIKLRNRQQQQSQMTEEQREIVMEIEEAAEKALSYEEQKALEEKKFFDYQFWKVPDQYNIDDLLLEEQ